jgi:hypothetical protein
MRRVAAVLLVMTAMASCAESLPGASGEPAQEEPASITVSLTHADPWGEGCCYIEGFVPIVRVVGPGVDVEAEFEHPDGDPDSWVEVVLEVPRGGEYTLESWVEPCAASCGAPRNQRDPATDHCSASIAVAQGVDLKVALTVRTRHPCRLSGEGVVQGEIATIIVSATYDESSCCYSEGFIGLVRIVGAGVDMTKELVLRPEVPGKFDDFELQSGAYSLKSWVEPCVGATCQDRDPPTDFCSATLDVRNGDDVKVDVLIRSSESCQVSVEGN